MSFYKYLSFVFIFLILNIFILSEIWIIKLVCLFSIALVNIIFSLGHFINFNSIRDYFNLQIDDSYSRFSRCIFSYLIKIIGNKKQNCNSTNVNHFLSIKKKCIKNYLTNNEMKKKHNKQKYIKASSIDNLFNLSNIATFNKNIQEQINEKINEQINEQILNYFLPREETIIVNPLFSWKSSKRNHSKPSNHLPQPNNTSNTDNKLKPEDKSKKNISISSRSTKTEENAKNKDQHKIGDSKSIVTPSNEMSQSLEQLKASQNKIMHHKQNNHNKINSIQTINQNLNHNTKQNINHINHNNIYNQSLGHKNKNNAEMDKIIQNLIRKRNLKQALSQFQLLLHQNQNFLNFSRFDILYPLFSEIDHIDDIIQILLIFQKNNIPFHSPYQNINTEAVSFLLRSTHIDKFLVIESFMIHSIPSELHLKNWKKLLDSQFNETIYKNKNFILCLTQWIKFVKTNQPQSTFNKYIMHSLMDLESYCEIFLIKNNHLKKLEKDSNLSIHPKWLKLILNIMSSKKDLETDTTINDTQQLIQIENCFNNMIELLASQECNISLSTSIQICKTIIKLTKSTPSIILDGLSLLCQSIINLEDLSTENDISIIMEFLSKSTVYSSIEHQLCVTYILSKISAVNWNDDFFPLLLNQWMNQALNNIKITSTNDLEFSFIQIHLIFEVLKKLMIFELNHNNLSIVIMNEEYYMDLFQNILNILKCIINFDKQQSNIHLLLNSILESIIFILENIRNIDKLFNDQFNLLIEIHQDLVEVKSKSTAKSLNTNIIEKLTQLILVHINNRSKSIEYFQQIENKNEILNDDTSSKDIKEMQVIIDNTKENINEYHDPQSLGLEINEIHDSSLNQSINVSQFIQICDNIISTYSLSDNASIHVFNNLDRLSFPQEIYISDSENELLSEKLKQIFSLIQNFIPLINQSDQIKLSLLYLNIAKSYIKGIGKVKSSLIDFITQSDFYFQQNNIKNFILALEEILSNDSFIISRESFVNILINLSNAPDIAKTYSEEFITLLNICCFKNISLVECMLEEIPSKAFLILVTNCRSAQLSLLEQYFTSFPVQIQFLGSQDQIHSFVNILKSTTQNIHHKIFYSLLKSYFSALNQNFNSKKELVQSKSLILAWNQTNLSFCFIRDLKNDIDPVTLLNILESIDLLANCLSLCVTRGNSSTLFGVLPKIVQLLPHLQNECQIQGLITCSSMIKLSEDEMFLKLVLISKDVLRLALRTMFSESKFSSIYESMIKVICCFTSESQSHLEETIDLESKLFSNSSHLSMNHQINILEYKIAKPMINLKSQNPRFQLYLVVKLFNQLNEASYEEKELMELLDQITNLISPTLNSIDSTSELLYSDIHIQRKSSRVDQLKPVILSDNISSSYSSGEYKKNVMHIWDCLYPLKVHIFKGIHPLDDNSLSFFGLDKEFSEFYPRINILVAIIRLIHDDLFFNFEFIKKNEIQNIITLCHLFINKYIKDHQDMDFDRRMTVVLDILSTLHKRNSTLSFIKTRYFYNKEISKYFRSDTQNIISHLVEDSKKTESSIYTTLFKRTPMLFDIKLKEAVFRMRINKLRSEEKDLFVIQRNNILESSFQEFSKRKKSDLKKHWKLKFEGEDTIDIRGVTREFVSLLSVALTSKESHIWRETDSLQVLPNSSSINMSKQDQLKYMEMSGRFLSKSFIEKELVDIRLCKFVLKKLLNKRLSYYDMQSVDRQLYENQILWIRDNDIEEALEGLTFSINFSDGSTVELIPGGNEKLVTNENKLEFLDALVEYKLTKELESHFQHLIKGFTDIVPLKEIYMFNEEEFELLLCGKETIDIEDLKRNSVLKFGYESNSATIKHLWDLLESFSLEDRRKFIQFVTGSPRVPVEGFKSLHPQFTIQRTEELNKLPSSSTCFNLLKLPDFKNKNQLRNKLKLILQEGVEGFGFS